MSRQSKNAKNLARAKQFSETRKKGGKSVNPRATHGKDFTRRSTYRLGGDYLKRMDAFLNGKQKTSARGTAGGNKILQGAGSAAA